MKIPTCFLEERRAVERKPGLRSSHLKGHLTGPNVLSSAQSQGSFCLHKHLLNSRTIAKLLKQHTWKSLNLICEFPWLLKHKWYCEFLHIVLFPHCMDLPEHKERTLYTGKSTASCRPQKPLQIACSFIWGMRSVSVCALGFICLCLRSYTCKKGILFTWSTLSVLGSDMGLVVHYHNFESLTFQIKSLSKKQG